MKRKPKCLEDTSRAWESGYIDMQIILEDFRRL